MFWGKLRKVCG